MTTIGVIEGRVSSMPKESKQRSAVLQGTLDMMILKTLLYGPAHGHQIGKHIQRATNEFLQMQHGSLYPALHRLEKRGWVVSKWETAPDRNREFKYYRLTNKGKKQLLVEESQWKQMAEAVARVMWPAAERVEMQWWQIKKRDADLERELRSDLELEEDEHACERCKQSDSCRDSLPGLESR